MNENRRKWARFTLPLMIIFLVAGLTASITLASAPAALHGKASPDSPLTDSRPVYASTLSVRQAAFSSNAPMVSIWCVSTTAVPTGGAPCTNATTLTTIQLAVSGAVSGDEIRVANGSYTGSGSAVAIIDKALTIAAGYSGAAGGWSSPGTDPNTTVIDGQGARFGLQIQSGIVATLRNFTVNNGGISNAGTASVQGGTINIAIGGTTNGTFDVGSGSFVVFPNGGQILNGVTFTGAGFGRVTGATINLVGTLNALNFELSTGTITNGAITIPSAGTFNWLGGTLDGVGTVTVSSGATMNLGGVSSSKVLSQRTFNMGGTTNMNGTGTGILYLSNGAILNNIGTFNIQNNDSILYSAGTSPQLNNSGILRKTGGAGISTVGNGFILLSNTASGTISAQAGTLSLDSVSNDDGSFTASVGAKLRFNSAVGDHVLSAISSVSVAGTIEFSAGTTYINGTYNVTGTTLMTGGIAIYGAPATITNLTIAGGTFRLYGNSSTLNVTNLDWSGGIIDGQGQGGFGQGTLNIVSGGTLNLGGVQSNKYLLQCTLNNNGTAVMNTTGTGVFYLGNGAVLNNIGTFNIQNNDSILYFGGAAPTINNTGTFRKTAGLLTSTVTNSFVYFNNSGTLDVQSGVLSLDGGSNSSGNSSTGNFIVTNVNSTLRFNGGTNSLQASSHITSTGTVEFSAGVVTIAGTFSVSGRTSVTGGTVGFNSNFGATTNNALLSAGTMGGAGVFNSTGRFDWNGGTMNDVGITNITPGGSLHLGGVTASKFLTTRTLNNNGSAYMDGTGQGFLYLSSGATFNNNSMFDIQNNDSVQYSSGVACTFNNNTGATLQKSQGAGISTLSNSNLAYNNYGTVNVMTGTLSLDGGNTTGLSSTGSFLITNASANLRFNGGLSSLEPGVSSVSGTGNVEFSAGTVSIAGAYNIGGTTSVTGGTVNFNTNATTNNALVSAGGTLGGSSPFALTINGTFNWTGGTLGGTGTTNVASSALMNIGGVSGIKVLSQRTLNNLGRARVNGTGTGVLYLSEGASLENRASGTFDIQNNDSILYNSGVSSIFTNSGVITKSIGAGITTIGSGNLGFLNNGLLSVLTGTVSLDGGTGNRPNGSLGAFTVASVANLRFNGGVHILEPSSSISGSGGVEFSAGVVTHRGTYDLNGPTGITRVTGGTVNFNASSSTTGVLFTVGTLSGSGTFTITGTFDWTGGIMSGSGTTNLAAVAIMNIGGVSAPKYLLQRTLNNNGTMYINGSGAGGVLYMGDGATLNNNASATFDIRNNDSILYSSGTNSAFNNYGTLLKSVGPNITTIGNGNLAFNNNGTLSVLTGTVSLDGPGAHVSGSFNLPLPIGNLRFNGSTNTLQSGTIITGTGNVEFSAGTVDINGAYNVRGITKVSGGTTRFNATASSSQTNFTVGFIGGSGTFTTTGTFDWTGGTMNGSGVTGIAASGVLNLGGVSTAKVLLQRTLNNYGTALMNGTGTGILYLGDGATFDNKTASTFDIQNNDSILYISGNSAAFNNSGAFRKSVGAGISTVANGNLYFNNSGGTVSAQSGVLNFEQHYLQTSGTTALGGGNLSTLTTLAIQGGSLIGTGTITGSVTTSNGGAVGPGASPGLLTINGSYTQGQAGVLNIELGGSSPGSGYDKLNVVGSPGTANLSGTLNLSLINGYVPPNNATFQIIGYSTHTNSTFAIINGSNIGNGQYLVPDYMTNSLTLRVSGTGPTSTPIPSGTRTPTTPSPRPTNTYTPVGTATRTPSPCPLLFTDVQQTDYFYEPVRYLYCRNVISGYGTEFRPYNNTTRGQLCKIVVLAQGWEIITSGGPHFMDVPTSNVFYPYVETAYNFGIIVGYDDGTFRSNNNVTRAQLCKIIVLARQWPINTNNGPHFTDVPTDYVLYGYIETGFNHGIIAGYNDATFRPSNSATRGQICKIVYLAITQP